MKRIKIILGCVVCIIVVIAVTIHYTHYNTEKRDEEKSGEVEVLYDKALEFCQGKSYEEALNYFEQCQLAFEKQGNEVSKTRYYGCFLNDYAKCHSALGNYSKAIELYSRTLEIIKNIQGENHQEYAVILDNLAIGYSDIGNYAKAIEKDKQALKIYKDVLGENHQNYANVLNNLASHYSHIGDYSKALEFANRALEIYKDVLGENHPYYARSISNLSVYYTYLGDYIKAIGFGNQAIDIIKEMPKENHQELARMLNNLAGCYARLGDYFMAIELERQAIKKIKDILGKDHPTYALSLNNLSVYYSDVGDYNKAIELANQALPIIKDCLGKDHPYYATLLNSLASYNFHLGNNSSSLELISQALEIRRNVLGEKHIDYAMSLKSLANYLFILGYYSDAIEFENQAATILYFHILTQFGDLIGTQRSSYWTIFMPDFTDWFPLFVYLSSSYHTSDLYDKSALFAKGLLLTTEIEMDRLIQESGDEETLSMFEEMRQKRLMLQKLYEKPIAERFINTDSLEQEADKLESELVKRSQVYGDFTRKLRTTWKDVQAALDDDEIAVEFLSFQTMGDSTMVVALTLRKDDKEPKMISLFEQKQLEKVKDIKISHDRGVRKTKTFYSHEVTDLVWKPMEEELKGIKRIYFSAAGILHKVGIEYAPGMEGYDIYRLSTTREVIDMKEKGEKNLNAQSDAVLYGGVDYEALAKPKATKAEAGKNQKDEENTHRSISIDLHHAFIDSLKVRGTDLKYLPGTLDEVKNISSCFEQKHRKTITGTDATETSVKSLPDKLPKILHIATHGFYYTESEKKRMDARKDLRLLDDLGNNGRQEDEALNRSGLFMAGANRTLKGEELPMEADDGILTAQEIAKIDLRGVDLVVLSACETGKGDINQGEGVYGLQRGFKKAGVQTILMSLWKVSDKATEILMTEFYRQVCSGKNTHESLRLAQKKVREYKSPEGKQPFEDPFFWAGFILLD